MQVKKEAYLIFLIAFLFLASTKSVSSFTFYGFVQNSTYGNATFANVSVYQVQQSNGPPAEVLNVSAIVNSSGRYEMTIPDDANAMWRIKVVLNASDGNVSEISPSLPPLPNQAIQQGLLGSTLFIQTAATIYITAVNDSGQNAPFNYIVKDKNVGFPVKSEFSSTGVTSALVTVPIDRNYSIMVMPLNSAPLQYTTTNITSYNTSDGTYYLALPFNTTMTFKTVSGYVLNTTSSRSNYTTLEIEAYFKETDGMTSTDFKIPDEMISDMVKGIPAAGGGVGPGFERVNATTGVFNITLPSLYNLRNGLPIDPFSVLIGAYAVDGNKGNATAKYYVAYQNVSISGANVLINITLSNATGSYIAAPSTLGNMGSSLSFVKSNIIFQQVNDSGAFSQNITQVHSELTTSLSAGNGEFTVKFMADTLDSGGSFKMPFPVNANVTASVFSNQYAPLEKEIDITKSPYYLNLTVFNMNKVGSGGSKSEAEDSDISVMFLKHTAACDVQVPTISTCQFGNSFTGSFNPLQALVAGKSNLRIKIASTGVILYLIGVDLFASGPPDADMSSAANSDNEDTTSNVVEQAWRFGSMAPDIYDYAYIGIPYSESRFVESEPINITIGALYDNDGAQVWNSTAYPAGTSIPSTWSDYNTSWFNASKGGMKCNNDTNSLCYINTTTNYIWLKIPHFSTDDFHLSGGADNTAPTTNATFTKDNVSDFDSDGNIELNWTDDANELPSRYRIYRSTSIINTTTTVTDSMYIANVTNGTQFFEDNTTKNGTLYWYTIVTVDSSGNYNASWPIRTAAWNATANDTIFPQSPTNLTATASGAIATLRWSNVTLDVRNNQDFYGMQYKLYYSTGTPNLSVGWVNDSNSGFTYYTTLNSNSTTYTYTATETTTTLHHFIVTTIDDAGNENKSIISSKNYVNISLTYTAPAAAEVSSSSGGGGGGAASAPVSTNVAASSTPKVWDSIKAEQTTDYKIEKPAVPVTQITFNLQNEKAGVELSVNTLNEKPASAGAPEGAAYKYLEIVHKNIEEKDLKYADITFKVEKSWLKENNYADTTVKLYRNENGEWKQLTTNKHSEDSKSVYYKATTFGFSYFAIIAKEEALVVQKKVEEKPVVEEGQITGEAVKEEVKEEEPPKVRPKIETIWWFVAGVVVVIALGAYYYRREYSGKKK